MKEARQETKQELQEARAILEKLNKMRVFLETFAEHMNGLIQHYTQKIQIDAKMAEERVKKEVK